MSEKTAKILIGLVGVLVLGVCALGVFEEEMHCHLGKEKSHDVLERGEKVVLEYLQGAEWTELEIYRNDILSIKGKDGIREAETVVTGKKKGKRFRLVMRYGFDSDCEVYGVTVLEKKAW